jgi:hypothetical protein
VALLLGGLLSVLKDLLVGFAGGCCSGDGAYLVEYFERGRDRFDDGWPATYLIFIPNSRDI